MKEEDEAAEDKEGKNQKYNSNLKKVLIYEQKKDCAKYINMLTLVL